nr:unnamed protein product [Digitaria exilis]
MSRLVSSVFSQSKEKRNFSEGLMTRFLGFLDPRYCSLIASSSFSRSRSAIFSSRSLSRSPRSPRSLSRVVPVALPIPISVAAGVVVAAAVPVPVPVPVGGVAVGAGGVAWGGAGTGRGRAGRGRWRRGAGQRLEEVERGAALVGDGGLAALEREALPLRLGEEHGLRRLRQRVGGALHGGGGSRGYAARGGRRVCACAAGDRFGEQNEGLASLLE